MGYIFYSRYIEKQFGISQEKTPSETINDGVDYVPLSLNKNMLIHLLNIAGLGPILGANNGGGATYNPPSAYGPGSRNPNFSQNMNNTLDQMKRNY